MWGVPLAKPQSFDLGTPPVPAAKPSPPSVVVDSRLAASESEDTVEVALEESSPSIDLASIKATASSSFDISEGDEIRTTSLSDLAQGGFQSAPVGEIEIQGDGNADDEIELAPANDFVPGAAPTEPEARFVPPPPKPPPPRAPATQAPAPASADGGEATLRSALSQASREVIEKIAWEVVPQLAEVIIREHVERLVRERSSK